MKEDAKAHGLWDVQKWNVNDPVPAMPDGLTPQEVVEAGILGQLPNNAAPQGCPFAWILQ